MKIKQVKELDDGVSGITIEGRIIKTPKPPGDSEYGWSQMIILKDDTGEIGSWINIESAEDAYKVGQYIKVQGKVSKYVKGNKPGVSLNNGKVIEEIVKDENVSQEKPTQKTTQNTEKVDDKVWRDKDLRMARESALKNTTEFVVNNKIKLEDRFKYAQEDVDFIYKDMITSEDITKEFGGTAKEEPKTKKERIEKAKEIAGKTEFKPASTLQKNRIFGYRDKEGWHKGMIESRYIEKEEIRKIGSPEKLSVEKASDWLGWWWGVGKEEGERKKREREHPRNENGTLVGSLVKGDKTSLAKDILIDDINALRRENFLIDDVKFEKEMGYNPHLENLTEEELSKLKGVLEHYNPL